MTEAPRDGVKDRILDAIFGSRGTPVERELFEAARPPKVVLLVITVFFFASVLWMVLTFLASHGWLPFVPRIARQWSTWSILPVAVTAVVQDQISKHYERRAKARMTPTS